MSIRTQRNSKRGVAAVVTAALGASLLAMTTPVGATATVKSVRIAGADRAATSVAISTAVATPTLDGGLGAPLPGYNQKFVVASSTSYADSVTAAALAGAKDATIVLLPADGSLSAAASARLAAATDVWIVGGPSVVPSTVEAAIQAASVPATIFTRLGGSNRFETAAAVLANIGSADIGLLAAKKTVILANSDNFADAVAAAPAAWRGDNTTGVHPVLLTPAGSLNAATKAAITASGATQVLILGGTSAISAAVASEVDAMTNVDIVRVGGANRFETAALLASVLIKSVGNGGLGFSAANVGLANIDAAGGGADALAASPYLGFAGAVLLGVSGSGVPAETAKWLSDNKATTTTLHVFGGTAAVSAATVDSALTSAGKVPNPTAVIVGKEKTGVATVVFSENVSQASAETVLNKYQLLALNGAVVPGGITSATMVDATNGVGKTVALGILTPATSAVAGATIQVLAGTILTADGRSVNGASFVIPADTTAPVATLTAVIGTSGGVSSAFQVSFSEAVSTALTADMFTRNGTDVAAIDAPTYTLGGAAATAALYDKATVVLTGPAVLGQAEVLALKAGKVKDPAGNSAGAASTSVIADNTKPTVVSATGVITATATAQLVLNSSLLLQAKTNGIAGEAVKVVVAIVVAPTTPSVSVDTTTSTITINALAATTAPAVKALLDASTAASALVSSTVLNGAGVLLAIGAPGAALDGGASTLKLTTTYSEAILSADGTKVTYDADGTVAVAAPPAVGQNTAPNEPVVSGSTVVTTHLLDSVLQLPALNTAVALYLADAADDFGSNPSVAKPLAPATAGQLIGF